MQAHISLPAGARQEGQLNQDTINQAAKLFRLHGTLALDNVFDPSLVADLQSSFMTEYAGRSKEEIKATCLQVGLQRYMFTIGLRPPFMNPDLYASPLILPIVRALLGQDCIIQSFGVVCAYPGSEMQHLHRDHTNLFEEAGGLNAFFPPYALHVVVPLVDLDEETGTTAMWEGSHRVKSRAEEQKYSMEEMDQLKGAALPWPKMGDCYFMDFRLRHRGTANRSDKPRPILYLVYSRRWFQDRKNFEMQSPLDITREEYDRIPDEYKHLFENARL